MELKVGAKYRCRTTGDIVTLAEADPGGEQVAVWTDCIGPKQVIDRALLLRWYEPHPAENLDKPMYRPLQDFAPHLPAEQADTFRIAQDLSAKLGEVLPTLREANQLMRNVFGATEEPADLAAANRRIGQLLGELGAANDRLVLAEQQMQELRRLVAAAHAWLARKDKLIDELRKKAALTVAGQERQAINTPG